MTQAYQGDVSLIKNIKLPELAFKKLPATGIIAAEGEVTGHNHRIVADREALVEFAQDANGIYIKVLKGSATIKHQEHKPITLDVGNWFVGKQVEYDEIAEIRQVRD